MKNLIIERTDVTPAIHFDHSSGELKISGRAYSNDINRFYADLNSWIDDYLENPQNTTTIILQLEYYNSSFYKLLFILIVKCKKLMQQGHNLIVKWRHQKGDEDSLEDASEISTIIGFQMLLEEIELENLTD